MSALPVQVLADKEVATAHATFAHHAKSFRLAANFLPRENLDDIAVLYHFCRVVDDAVDEAPTPEEAHGNLMQLRGEIEGTRTPSPSNQAFLLVQNQHAIPNHAIMALMQGCESDLYEVLIHTPQELAMYCYNVAGAVGEMMCPLINVTEPEATQYAIDLGLGMQITNICRDVLEDAERGRVYIPSEWLEQAHLTHADILSKEVNHVSIAMVTKQMLNVAEVCYRRAYIGCRYIPFRSRIGILVARRVYRAIGLKLLKAHDGNPFHGRTMLSKWEKFWQVGLGFLDALNPVTLGWWKPKIPDSPLYQRHTDLIQQQNVTSDEFL